MNGWGVYGCVFCLFCLLGGRLDGLLCVLV